VLANWPVPAGLSFLAIGDNEITDRGARLLLRSPHLARISHVDSRVNKVEDPALLAALAERFLGG
jgi:hypothetical protein